MSLASFHIFFIVVSTLAALGAGVWGVGTWAAADGDAISALLLGVLSLATVPVLVVYGVRVRAKLRALGA